MSLLPGRDTFLGRNLRRAVRVPLRIVRPRRPIADRTLRLSSFPFVSGDGIALGLEARSRLSATDVDTGRLGGDWWFSEGAPLEVESGREALLERAREMVEPPTLVIHNGDIIPPPEFFEVALGVFRSIWSVNVIEESDRVRALPIGLANLWLHGAKDLAEFLAAYRSTAADVESSSRRPVQFMASFRTTTNPAVRAPFADLLEARGISNDEFSRDGYRHRLLESRFVLSPPGNGTDCHRTWEALCMGAVPVILRSSLAPSLVEGTPIVAVDDWDEVLSLSSAELDELHARQVALDRRSCLLDPWLDRITAIA